MTGHPHAELVPLAALGALDGEDRSSFEAHVVDCGPCRAELVVHEMIAARIGLGVDSVPPRPAVRSRILEGVSTPGGIASARPPGGRRSWPMYASLAAVVVMGVNSLMTRRDRERALAEAEVARGSARGLEGRLLSAEAELQALRTAAAKDRGLRDLLAHPDSRVATLAGLGPFPLAHGRMVWKPDTREATLLTLGLPPAPAGKEYAVWVIGSGPPAPAGLFQVDADGNAVIHLPRIYETSGARSFAVTLEPAGGGPSPTGHMVLAGSAS